MNVIVFASRKGGSGKSTLAAHLAAQIKASKSCLLIDADPQGSLTLWHNGQTGGYHAFCGFVPGRGGVVVLCNVAAFDVDKVGAAVINQLAEAQ